MFDISIEKNKEIREAIRNFFIRNKKWKFLLEECDLTYSELLCFISNNHRKQHGIPLIRKGNRKKKKNMNRAKLNIIRFKVYKVIENMVDTKMQDERFCKELFNNCFKDYIDTKNLNIGEQNKFEIYNKLREKG